MRKKYWFGALVATFVVFSGIRAASGLSTPPPVPSPSYPPAIINGCVYNPDGTKHTGNPRLSVRLLHLTTHQTTGEPIRNAVSVVYVTIPTFTYDNIEPGCFRFHKYPSLVAGSYVVQVSEMMPPTGTNTFHSHEASLTITDPTVAQTLDFHLTAPTKFITGTVVDTSGVAAVGQLVQIRRLDTGVGEYWNNTAAAVKTASDGSFTAGVSSNGGSFAIDAQGDGITFLESRNINLPNRQVITFANDSSVETKTALFNDLNRIGSATKIVGKVVGLNDLPVKEKAVTVFANLSTNFSVGALAETDATGGFSLKVSPGTYTVRAQLSQYDEKTWVNYPAISVNVIEGQTVDLGTIKPIPLSTIAGTAQEFQPTIIRQGQNTVLLSEATKKVHSIRFNESFAAKTFFDARASSGVLWKNGALVFSKPVTTSSSGVRLASAQTTGIVVSKIFTPKGLRVRSILLNDYLTPTTRGTVSYSVSPDGTTWLAINPGEPTNLPTTWNTKNGLRWRAIGATDSETIKIRDLTILYSVSRTTTNPSITNVAIAKDGKNAVITVTGKNFAPGSFVYLGSKAITKTTRVNSTTLRATVVPSEFLNRSYALTVIGPKLELGTTKKKVNPRLVSIR